MYHEPVLLDAVLAAARDAKRAVDATLGDGGHAEAMRAQGAELLAIDRDPEALRVARARLGEQGIRYLHTEYSSEVALQSVAGFHPEFILLDLGVSSRQLDRESSGFSFRPGVPLDMRMGDGGPTAAELLNAESETRLEHWLAEYADEPRARRLAGEIVKRRERTSFLVSDDLVNAIRAVLGPRSGPADFARIFQALRIAVNDELEGLARALPAFRDALTAGGALAAISYHSGEDRLVKQAFHDWSRACVCPPAQPVCTCRGRPLGQAVPRGGVVPDAAEVAMNPRARSARLRIFRAASDA